MTINKFLELFHGKTAVVILVSESKQLGCSVDFDWLNFSPGNLLESHELPLFRAYDLLEHVDVCMKIRFCFVDFVVVAAILFNSLMNEGIFKQLERIRTFGRILNKAPLDESNCFRITYQCWLGVVGLFVQDV